MFALNNPSTLILLTNYYPFLKGEEYLESEISYLSQEFERIIVIATMVPLNSKMTRSIPDNVVAEPIGFNHGISDRIRMILTNYQGANQYYRLNSQTDLKLNIFQSMYEKYFAARTIALYPKLKLILESNDVLPDTKNITIYSYWLYITSSLAIMLKENYFNSRPWTISRAHGYDVNEEASPLQFLPYRNHLLKELDAIYPVSSAQVRDLQVKFPNYRDKLHHRALGVHSTLSSFLSIAHKMSSPTIVSISAIRQVKRVDLIVKAFAKLLEMDENQNVKWVHFGTGPDETKVKKLASQLLPEDTYEFKGHVPNEDVKSWLENEYPRALINVSSSEGVPVSIMEACSFGVPIIATDVGGNSDAVKDGINGCLLSAHPTLDEIVQAMDYLVYASQEEFLRLSQEAFNLWSTQFNAEIQYKNFSRELKLNQIL